MEDEAVVGPALALDRSADNTAVFINFNFTVKKSLQVRRLYSMK
jgi:hypothetical protein